jgi:hypothetical protein
LSSPLGLHGSTAIVLIYLNHARARSTPPSLTLISFSWNHLSRHPLPADADDTAPPTRARPPTPPKIHAHAGAPPARPLVVDIISICRALGILASRGGGNPSSSPSPPAESGLREHGGEHRRRCCCRGRRGRQARAKEAPYVMTPSIRPLARLLAARSTRRDSTDMAGQGNACSCPGARTPLFDVYNLYIIIVNQLTPRIALTCSQRRDPVRDGSLSRRAPRRL